MVLIPELFDLAGGGLDPGEYLPYWSQNAHPDTLSKSQCPSWAQTGMSVFIQRQTTSKAAGNTTRNSCQGLEMKQNRKSFLLLLNATSNCGYTTKAKTHNARGMQSSTLHHNPHY